MKFHLVPKLSCNKKVTYDVVTKAFFNFTLHMTIELGNTMWINFWELQLIKKLPNFVIWLQIRKLEIFIRQSSNFWQHSKDHYRKCYTRFVYYLIHTMFVEIVDAAVWQTIKVLCCAVSFKAIQPLQKCCKNRFCRIAETAIQTESKQCQTKKQNILIFTPST